MKVTLDYLNRRLILYWEDDIYTFQDVHFEEDQFEFVHCNNVYYLDILGLSWVSISEGIYSIACDCYSPDHQSDDIIVENIEEYGTYMVTDDSQRSNPWGRLKRDVLFQECLQEIFQHKNNSPEIKKPPLNIV